MTDPIPVVNIPASFASLRAEIDAAIKRVMDSSSFVLGPELAAFESELAAAVGTHHAVGVASGTDALHLALRALNVGVGDEVAVPALTFFATAEAVVHAGATPLVIDVDDETSTMSVSAFAEVASRVKAVIPVHLYGHPADMDPILELAQQHNVAVVEDACQAIAATYKGRAAGTLGDAAAFSFYPTKNLGGAGDGGALTTDDEQIAARVRRLRHHGQENKDLHEEVGYTSRLDDLQAAILRVKLPHIDAYTKARRQIAAWYADALAGLAVEPPQEAEWAEAAYHLYVVQVDDRDRVAQHLRDQQIGCAVYYQVPLSRQPALARMGLRYPDMPNAERIVTRQLALPMFPEMTHADVEAVAAALRSATR